MRAARSAVDSAADRMAASTSVGSDSRSIGQKWCKSECRCYARKEVSVSVGTGLGGGTGLTGGRGTTSCKLEANEPVKYNEWMMTSTNLALLGRPRTSGPVHNYWIRCAAQRIEVAGGCKWPSLTTGAGPFRLPEHHTLRAKMVLQRTQPLGRGCIVQYIINII